MTILYNIDTVEVHQLRHTIRNITNSFNIKDIYISIGGKFITNISNFFEHSNNSNYHIIPIHLISKDTHSLIIVLDLFSQIEFDMCRKNITNNDDNNHIILCNSNCNTLFIEKFILYILKICNDNYISSNNLIICNYIKFKNNPNPSELQASKLIPNVIYSILKRPDNNDYVDCFYEWFGYNQYLYNFIYKYKYYMIYRGAYTQINMLQDTLDKIKKNDNYKLISKDIKSINFWKHVYDITDNNNQHQLTSIFDNLYSNRKILISK